MNIEKILKYNFAVFVFGILFIVTPFFAEASNASFVSQSVPSTMFAGQTYSVSVTMKNSADYMWWAETCAASPTWKLSCGYRLGSQNPQDNATWGFGRVDLGSDETVAQGATKTFTFNVTAPQVSGTYNFQWQMVQDGVAWFGDKTPNVAVTVSSSCVPKTCVTLGNYTCGSWNSGCGNILNCGICNAGQNCTNGVCVVNCVPKTCVGLGYSCGIVSDGCGNTLNCGVCVAGGTCSNGKCVADCAVHSSKKCNSGKLYWYDSCGGKEELYQDCGTDILTNNYRCSGNWTQREASIMGCSGNACTSVFTWNNSTDCAASGKVCSNGICADACVNECTVSGAKQCAESGYRVCNDNNGCLEWSEIIACGAGKTCLAGACSLNCVAKTCAALGGYECGNWSDGCGETMNCGICETGKKCSSGQCVMIDSDFPSVTIVADSSHTVYAGDGAAVTLSWNSSQSDYCAASGAWSGNLNASGTQTVAAEDSKTYTITCSNSYGSSSDSAVVSVYESPAKITRAEILAKIAEIKNLIADLQKQMLAITDLKAINSCARITKKLYYGMKNDSEVQCLQEVLKAQGFAVIPTGDYGGITKAAVKQFQEKHASEILTPYGLEYGTGNVGNATMAKVNALIAAN